MDGLLEFLEKFLPCGIILIDLSEQKVGRIAVEGFGASVWVGFEVDAIAGPAEKLEQRRGFAPQGAWAGDKELFFLAGSGDADRLEPLEQVSGAKGKAAVVAPMKAIKVDTTLFFEHGDVDADVVFDARAQGFELGGLLIVRSKEDQAWRAELGLMGEFFEGGEEVIFQLEELEAVEELRFFARATGGSVDKGGGGGFWVSGERAGSVFVFGDGKRRALHGVEGELFGERVELSKGGAWVATIGRMDGGSDSEIVGGVGGGEFDKFDLWFGGVGGEAGGMGLC